MKNFYLSIFLLLAYMTSLQAQQSISFNGTTQHLSIPDDPTFSFPSAFSLEAWVRADNWQGADFQGVIISNAFFPSNGVFLRTGNSIIGFGKGNGNGTYHFTSNNAGLATQRWYHLAGTYDGSTVRVYINDV